MPCIHKQPFFFVSVTYKIRKMCAINFILILGIDHANTNVYALANANFYVLAND